MEWFNSNIAYWHWMVVGMLLVASEIFLPSFVMIWFGASAIAVGLILAAIDISFNVQLMIWALLSAIDLFVWFKFVQPKMKTNSLSGMSREQILGQEGMIIKLDTEPGRATVRFSIPLMGSEEWACISESDLEVGQRVTVRELSGNSLIVD